MANKKLTSVRGNIRSRVSNRVAEKTEKRTLAPNRALLLVTVVNRNKAEFFVDLLQSFEVNLQLDVSAFGTAPHKYRLVAADPEKQVIFSVIRQDNVKKALDTLLEKFDTLKGCQGIAFTVPISGTIGVAVYQFLTNVL